MFLLFETSAICLPPAFLFRSIKTKISSPDEASYRCGRQWQPTFPRNGVITGSDARVGLNSGLSWAHEGIEHINWNQ